MFKFSVLIICLLSSLAYAKQTQPLSLSVYAQYPAVSAPQLSPDGTFVSFLAGQPGQQTLAVQHMENDHLTAVVKTDNIASRLDWYLWANNNTLLLSISYPSNRNGVATLEKRLFRHIIGKDQGVIPLLKPRSFEHLPQFSNGIISLLADDPAHVLIQADFKHANKPAVYKVNIETQRKRLIQYHKSYVKEWYSDLEGNVRLGFAIKGTEAFYIYRPAEKEEWKTIWRFNLLEDPDIDFIGFDSEPNIAYIRADYQGKYALFKVNMDAPEKQSEPIFSDPDYDFDGSLIYAGKNQQVVGIRQSSAESSVIYWQKQYKTLQSGLNKIIPNASNSIIDTSRDERFYIMRSNSDSNPGSYYIGDRKKKKIKKLAERYPQINETNYAGKHHVRIKARDGLNIEAYVTRPINTQPDQRLPAVVLPHGGPMSRDYSGYDYWSEMLASRGYIVIQPNFRGSSGYGFDFERQAIQGWGQAMQDDLQDAAHWLVENANADNTRICILGGSYGGYAALMGAVKHPETYRCAISIAGVSDLEMVYWDARKYTNKEIKRKQFGHDQKQLQQASPVNFAEDIEIPILLIHSDKDRVVPVKHSRNMADELEDEDKDVRYLELEGGDHHLSAEQHRLATLQEIERFLAEQLQKPRR